MVTERLGILAPFCRVRLSISTQSSNSRTELVRETCRSTRHVAGEVVIWALAASTILRYQVKGPQLKVWAYVCNTIGVVTPIATIATSLTLSVLGGIAYSNAVGTYDKLNAFFIEESLTWSSTNLTNHFVPPPNDLVQDFEANLGKIKRWWRVSFLFQGIVGATLTVALVVVAVMYLFSLRKSIVKLGQTLGTDSLVGREGSRQHLKTTWTVSTRLRAHDGIETDPTILCLTDARDRLVDCDPRFSLCFRPRSLHLPSSLLLPISYNSHRASLRALLPLLDPSSHLRNRPPLQCGDRALFLEGRREELEDDLCTEMDDVEAKRGSEV